MKKKTYPLYYEGKKQKFARSVVSGGFVFLSGSSGRTIETGEVSSNDVTEQTKVALDKIKLALAEAGSSLEHIVKMTIYLRNMSDYQAMKDAEFQYYQKHAPSLAEAPRPARLSRWFLSPNRACSWNSTPSPSCPTRKNLTVC